MARLVPVAVRRLSTMKIRQNRPSTSSNEVDLFVPDLEIARDIVRNHGEKVGAWDVRLRQADELRRTDLEANRPKITSCIAALRTSLAQNGRQLVPIGSVANGLWSSSSDIDLIFVTSDDEKARREFNSKFATSQSYRSRYMTAVKGVLQRCPVVTNFALIENAKVPILKLQTSDQFSVDIQFNNICSISSTLYQKTAIQHDARIAAIIHWLKTNMAQAGLTGGRHGLFTSYHIAFLVLHFLNRRLSGVELLPPNLFDLPQLEPEQWQRAAEQLENENPVESRSSSPASPCALSTAELTIHLIAYYSQLDLSHLHMDLRGKVVPRSPDDGQYFLSPFISQEEARCSVHNASHLLSQHFSSLKDLLQQGLFSRV